MNIVELLNNFFTVITVFGPIINYLPQYRLMTKNNSLGSFSTLTCYILLIANLLRVIFWFGKAYLLSLLLQSIIMIIVQMVLLRKCYHILNRKDSRGKFLGSILMLTLSSGTYYAFFSIFKNNVFIEVTGGLSACIEAMLPFPQFVTNIKRKSVVGLSFSMIFMWFVGDAMKLVYYLGNDQPLQFIICAIIQLVIDVCILSQFVLYRKKAVKKD